MLERDCVLYTKGHLAPLLQTSECPRKTEDMFCISSFTFTAGTPSCPQLCIHRCLCYLQLLKGKMWLDILYRATVASSEKSLEVTIRIVFGSRLLRQGFPRLLASTEICSWLSMATLWVWLRAAAGRGKAAMAFGLSESPIQCVSATPPAFLSGLWFSFIETFWNY